MHTFSQHDPFNKKYQKRKKLNSLMYGVLAIAALVPLIPLSSLVFCLISRGTTAFHWNLFTELPKPIGEPGGGLGNAILGTWTLVSLASFLGVPWGMLLGIFLAEYKNSRLSMGVRLSADILASTPSIIVGLFIYHSVVLPMRHFSAWAGGMTLGILIVPHLARNVEDLLTRIPTHIREAGLALGLSRWKVIFRIVIRGSLKPIATSLLLSIARIAGETAPLLFTALNNRFWQKGWNEPIASLPVQIYNYAMSPYTEWNQQAWAGALLLVGMIFMMNLTTRFVLGSRENSR